ncbi:glycosyltransferase [Nocardioides flavus (ex Wang et al. 2016)]|nr:nucleotide disphospho-sugar-binding domain-containing protein [Nocardioides flavus (ex Wang et al. 2016)]
MVPLARALRSRGHDVAVATERGWHAHVEAEGLDALAAGCPHDEAWQGVVDTLGDASAVRADTGQEVFALLFAQGHAHRKARELADVAERWGADAVVFESGDLAAPAVAAALGVPAVHHSWGPMIPLAWFEAASERVAPVWDALGVPPARLAGAFDGLYVDLAPARFRTELPPGEVTALRPTSPDPAAVPDWVADLEPPVVYATLGTLFNSPDLLRTLLAALDGVGSAVLTTGRDVDPAELGAVPANVRVERFVPQTQVLPRAAAAIGHGGSGSTLGALAQGVPLVLLPMGADQFHVATGAAAAGAAVVLRPDEVTPASVRAALDAVLADEAYGRAAGAVRAEVAAMPTPEEAAVVVERFLRSARPPRP